MSITGGTLGAVLALRNDIVPQYQGQLATFTSALVQAIDDIQATGLGLSGPLTSVIGQRGVTNTTVPLARAGLAMPPQQGTLTISVTDQATGQITNNRLAIDPSAQSLEDVANAINGIGHIQAVVNTQNGTLSIVAQPGYAFDFAGRLPGAPDTQAIAGTATPQVSGSYTGGANDTLTYTVTGSGQVGVSGDLNVEVRNSAGTLLGKFNVGQGYSPGSAVAPVDGVHISMSAGTLNAGDSFTVNVTANADTAGILPALGINTFFTGSSPADIQVNSALLNDPSQLATSVTGAAGDAGNLQRLIALESQPIVGGTESLSQYLAGFIGDVATRVHSLTAQQSAQQSVSQSLQTQQQAVSGVNPNEELVKLLQYQQGYQMSAQYISLVHQTTQYLFTLFG
jgi:flagellar hook-associated protein 1 FlgK